MLKRLSVLAAMRDMNTFIVTDLAASSGVAENTVQTVLQRMDEAWLTKEAIPTGAKGRAPVRYSLTAVGLEGVARELGKVASATNPRTDMSQPVAEVLAPLGLESAEDTVKLLATASPKRAAAFRRDAARDLKWAVAELQGEAYRGHASALLSRVDAVRAALGDEFTKDEHESREKELLMPVYELSHSLAPSARDVEVLPMWPAAPEAEETIFERWRKRASAFFRGRRSSLEEGLWSTESPGFAFNSGRHVVLACLATDDSTRELAFGAKWALNGAINVIRNQGVHRDLKVHTVGPKHLQMLIVGAKSHRDSLSNTTFVFLVNSEELQEQVDAVLQDTNAFEVLNNAQMLDCSFNSRLQETTMRYHCRYVPNAVDTGRMDWIQDTMAEVSRGLASLTFEPSVARRFRSSGFSGSTD